MAEGVAVTIIERAVQPQDAVDIDEATAAFVIDWNELHRLYGPPLRRFIASRVPSPYVEDVLQETFVRVYRSRARVDLTTPLWPWLVTLARRSSVDHWRSHREIPVADPVAADHAAGRRPEDELESAELRSMVDGILASMPPRQRRLLRLSAMDGAPPALLADEEAVSSEVIRSALVRARRGFRRRYLTLTEETGALSGVAILRALSTRLREAARRITNTLREGLPSVAVVGAAAGIATVAGLGMHPGSVEAQRPPERVGALDGQAVSAGVEVAAESAPRIHAAHNRPPEPAASAGRAGPGTEKSPLRVPSAVSDFDLGPDESYVRLRVEWTDPAGDGHGETSFEVKCERSAAAREACAVLREVPGVESGQLRDGYPDLHENPVRNAVGHVVAHVDRAGEHDLIPGGRVDAGVGAEHPDRRGILPFHVRQPVHALGARRRCGADERRCRQNRGYRPSSHSTHFRRTPI